MINNPVPLVIAFAALALCPGVSAVTIDNSTYRIGMSHDGNQHDQDDFGASALAMAMVAEAGIGAKLVHVDFNNHLGNNNSSQASSMTTSVSGAKMRWNLTGTSTFDCQQSSQLTGAINNIKAQINASTASDRFYYGCVGPMEVAWRGINASNSSARTNATAISHSSWNETHADTSSLTHNWTDIKNTGIKTIDIRDQNSSNGDDDFNTVHSAWYWLRDGNTDWNWLYNRNVKSTFDVSDAGVMWYIITGRGDQLGGASKCKDLFNGNFTYTGGGGGSFPKIEAESFSASSGVKTETCSEGGQNIGFINNGDYTAYSSVNLAGATGIDLRVASNASGGTIEVRLGSTTGTLLSSVSFGGTGGWQTWVTKSGTISGASGTHTVYLVYKGTGTLGLFNVNWLKFK